ncbi:hypothetical protein [Gallaecimonas xiamenensis]|nr:hypothetical protein [Gallaecimonas xiamenensis]
MAMTSLMSTSSTVPGEGEKPNTDLSREQLELQFLSQVLHQLRDQAEPLPRWTRFKLWVRRLKGPTKTH